MSLDIIDAVEYLKTRPVMEQLPERGELLAGYITAVSRHIDERFGPVVKRPITAEAHHGGGCEIALQWYPVDAITSVTENGVALSSSDYHIDSDSGLLERSGGSYSSGRWA